MTENQPEKMPPVPPFVRFVASAIPMTFDDSLSYYEALCALWKYVQGMTDVINNNATLEEEYIQLTKDMKVYMDTYFENLDVQEEINNKLDDMVEDGTLEDIIGPYLNEKLATLPYDDKNKMLLYAYFDTTDSDRISIYSSEDGVNLKLVKKTNLTGRDPSIQYINGVFYIAVTDYGDDHDFLIYTSTDLQTWETHSIDAGIRGTVYNKVWCPDWFIDDNDKIYITVARQYANTEGNGDFDIYYTECTDLATLTFGTAHMMQLNDATSRNHIDPAIIKINSTYHMFVKDETVTSHKLEHYTSNDFENWQRVSVDPCNFGAGVEGPILVKFNGEYYLSAERYTTRTYSDSYYVLVKTADFTDYSDKINVIYPDIDISHGSAIVIDKELYNGLINQNYLAIEDVPAKLMITNTFDDYDIVCTRTTVDDSTSGTRCGNYVELFSVDCVGQYRNNVINFALSTSTHDDINGQYNLSIDTSNKVDSFQIAETSCGTYSAAKSPTAGGQIIVTKDDNNNKRVHVYLDITSIPTTNTLISMKICNSLSWNVKITKYIDKFLDALPYTTTVKYCPGSFYSLTKTINNGANTAARIVFATFNGAVKIYGTTGTTDLARLIDSKLFINNNSIRLVNSNASNTDNNITVTLENYNSTTREYTIDITNIHTNSALVFEVPPSPNSYIKSITYHS